MKRSVAAAAIAVVSLPVTAGAAAFTVGARTEVQLQEFRSIAGRDPADPFTLQRQRLVQYLQLGAFDLGERGPQERIDVVTSLRLDQDFGLTATERRLLGLEQPAVNLLFGYVQWRGALSGLLDARLGRQIVTRQVEFWSFDGLDLTVHVPRVPLAVTGFGGFLVSGSSFLGTATFGPDGVRVSDRRRIDDGASTSLVNPTASAVAYDYLDAPRPVFGGRVDLEGVRDLSAGVAYRRSINRTTGEDLRFTPAAAKGWQVVQERLTAEAQWRPVPRLELQAAADEDLVRLRPAALLAGARFHVIPYRLATSLQWSLYNPSFDSDSIWNVFATGSRQEFQLRADVAPEGRWRFAAALLASVYGRDLQPDFFADAGGADVVPGLHASAGTKPGLRLRLGLDLSWRGLPGATFTGDRTYLGREVFATALAGWDLVPGWNALDARLSLANVDDPYQEALGDLWSTSLALISRNRITDEAEVLVIGEGAVNRYSQPDLRAYAVLQLQAEFR